MLTPAGRRGLRRYAGFVTGTQGTQLGLDVAKPNVARMYDYYLGGKDNFEADRIAAEKVLALVPGLRRAAPENRRFLRRVVRFLAAEAGVSQFLDIGVGLPTQGAVHEVAREVNPEVRVVYVDYDPVVVSHSQGRVTATATEPVPGRNRFRKWLLDLGPHFAFDPVGYLT
jgi:hypothetical protein